MGRRVVIHIDMDAFFAAVEERDDPALKGKPIGVIGSNARTVLVTSSYKAREFGVKTGMNVPEARAICPDIILVKADHEKYTAICRQIVHMLDDFSPTIEVFSIDEFFVDATGASGIFGPPLEMAKKIKARIKKDTGLNASIGIAPNKLLAKLGSDTCKPNGIKEIREEHIDSLLKDLPVDELCGIGKSTSARLRRMGITTCGQLGKANREKLINTFGVVGESLHNMGNGWDDSPVVAFASEAKEKSMGHSLTLPRDIRDTGAILKHMLRLSEMVGIRLRRENLAGDTISITIRYKSFKTFSKQKKIDIPTNDTRQIYKTASFLLNSVDLKEPVRLIGVGVSRLKESFPVMSLFKEDEKSGKLDRARDTINNIFGSDTIQFASIAEMDRPEKVISPSWRPTGGRRY